MRNNNLENIFKKISVGIGLSILFCMFIFIKFNNFAFAEIIFYDIIPTYAINQNVEEIIETAKNLPKKDDVNNDVYDNKKETVDVIGLNEISYHEKDEDVLKNSTVEPNNNTIDVDKLKDLDYLKNKFYIVDKKTGISEDYFNVDKFLNTDLKIEKSLEAPKVLIFHTHSQEMFADSNPNDIYEGIVGAGKRLAETLEKTYGIKTIHVTDSFDIVDGKYKILGAYERMEPKIRQVLEQNPSIELVIDLHRDGINENTKLVKNINGKPTAQIMFFNGISRTNENGSLKNIANLENPYVETNLALSFNMQKASMEKYPGFSRKIYINAYRYSLHMLPKSMLIEMGAQTNTKQEIFNAVDILAELINDVIFNG